MAVRSASRTGQPPFTPREIPSIHICYRPQAGRIRWIEKFSDVIGNLTRNLPACSIVPQPTMLPRGPLYSLVYIETGHDLKTDSMLVPGKLAQTNNSDSHSGRQWLSWLSSVPPGSCHNSTLNEAMTISFYTFPIHYWLSSNQWKLCSHGFHDWAMLNVKGSPFEPTLQLHFQG
jgi:hypothetical protein